MPLVEQIPTSKRSAKRTDPSKELKPSFSKNRTGLNRPRGSTSSLTWAEPAGTTSESASAVLMDGTAETQVSQPTALVATHIKRPQFNLVTREGLAEVTSSIEDYIPGSSCPPNIPPCN